MGVEQARAASLFWTQVSCDCFPDDCRDGHGAMGATERIRPGRRVAVGACMRIISEARVVAPCKGTGRACAARNVACRQAVLLKPSGISDQAGPSALQPGTHPQFFAGAPGVRCRRALLPPGHPRAGGRHRAPAA